MKHFFVLLYCILLSACIASGSGDPDPFPLAEPASVPQLSSAPVSAVTLSADYKGLLIGTDGLLPDGSLSLVWAYNQRLYELTQDNELTPVPILDTNNEAFDLQGNIVFPEREGLIPNDLMVMNERYVLLAVRKRDTDGNADNDYHNLFIDLTNGTATSAPLGLNKEGNSGAPHLSILGRDYFPPDQRWNDTDDLYVIDIDYETLGLMENGEWVEDEYEPVDHSAGVPEIGCLSTSPTQQADDTDIADETEPVADDTITDETTDPVADPLPSETAEECTEDSLDAQVTEEIDNNNDVTPAPLSLESMGLKTPRNLIENDPDSDTDSDLEVVLSNGSDPVLPLDTNPSVDDEPKTPTAVYRVRLGADGTYSLDKVSAPGDRPALGQFIASRSGVLIYRNEDGGDNSYRVLLSGCEDVTGRLSTVLFLKNSTLLVADDNLGNSNIYEVTQRGINKLLFSCNGNVIRESFSGYSQRVTSLAMPTNATSIAPYEYQYPYLLNPSCDSIRLFPRSDPEAEVINPMPPTPGLASQDTRGLRKAQYIGENLYCIGYNASLRLTIAQLNTTQAPQPSFTDLGFSFDDWRPDFETLHMLDDQSIIYTGKHRYGSDFQTILLTTEGEETDLTETLAGLEIKQHIEITPPPAPTAATEAQ